MVKSRTLEPFNTFSVGKNDIVRIEEVDGQIFQEKWAANIPQTTKRHMFVV